MLCCQSHAGGFGYLGEDVIPSLGGRGVVYSQSGCSPAPASLFQTCPVGHQPCGETEDGGAGPETNKC